jgi:type VI secretion system protein ImpC
MGTISTMSFAPFIGGTSSKFFNLKDWRGLSDLKDIGSILEMPQYGKWNDFRQSDVARNVGLVLPRFLARTPYGPETEPVKGFNYTETMKEETDYLWSNAVYALAARINDSFANYRWSANIVGPQSGGKVEGLPSYSYDAMGQIETKIPTETLISERREYELAEHGFIPLTMRKNGGDAVFFSANSAQAAKVFPDTAEGKAAELNFRLGTQLPYMFLVTRLAHYIKVIQRENLGSWKTKGDVERELNIWLSQYVVDMANPVGEVRSRKPFRAAEVVVDDVPGEAGWYRCSLSVSPHFKYMGANFTLSLVGKLEKAS